MTQKKMVMGLCLSYALMVTVSVVPHIKSHPAKLVQSKTYSKSPTQIKLERFIKDEYIAECISQTKYPYLLAAIAQHESGYRPQIKGDNGESEGLYQIQPKHHGAVPDSVAEQTKKAERLLGQLIQKHGIEKGIERYNGKGKAARLYARRVIKTSKEIERIQV